MSQPLKQDGIARFQEAIEADAGDGSVPGGAWLEELVQRVASGEHLPGICRAKGYPYARVMRWLVGDVARWEEYLRALEMAAHAEVAETLEIADGATPAEVAVAKLRVETRFRRARAHAGRVYGEKHQVEVAHSVSLVDVLSGLPRGAGVLPGPGTQAMPGGLESPRARVIEGEMVPTVPAVPPAMEERVL